MQGLEYYFIAFAILLLWHCSSCTHDYTPSCEIQLCSTDATEKNCKVLLCMHIFSESLYYQNCQQTDTRGLVYADIAASFNQQSNQWSIASIDLAADRPVEYAQINHTLSTSHSIQQHKGNYQLVEGGTTMIVTIVKFVTTKDNIISACLFYR